MKLSVIVPVYNTEEYLSDCVDSILNQTMSDLELILVNDGSTDGSAGVIADYVQRFPDKVSAISLVNGGQGRARNFGIEAACGEFLSFIDSDDYLEPDCYELMLAAAEAEGADVVVCDMEKRFDDGRREYVHAALQEHPLASAGSSSNKIFRRSKVGQLRFPVGLWYEDFAFSAKMLISSGKTVFVKKALYIYRCGQSSTMNNNNARKNLDIIAIMEEIRNHALAEGDKAGFEFLLINHVLLDSIKRLSIQSSADKKEIIKELRAYVRRSIPNLSACLPYQQETRNRRIIMALNYYGLEDISKLILSVKNK